MNLFKRL